MLNEGISYGVYPPFFMMHPPFQYLYRLSHGSDGLLYAWFSAMHTRVDIMLCSPKSEEELILTVRQIYDAVHRLEKIANYYDPTSELACVNRTASAAPVVLSAELYTMIDLCLEYNARTFGCFDVTIHSEGYNQGTIHSVRLSADGRTIFFQRKGITINLSGFLKGYTLDCIKFRYKSRFICQCDKKKSRPPLSLWRERSRWTSLQIIV